MLSIMAMVPPLTPGISMVPPMTAPLAAVIRCSFTGIRSCVVRWVEEGPSTGKRADLGRRVLL